MQAVMTMEPTKTALPTERTPEAMAEVFWLAFNGLSEPEKQAIMQRLLAVKEKKSNVVVKPVHLSDKLIGLVSLGGDAVEDSERYYDQ